MAWQTVVIIVAVLAVLCFYRWCDVKKQQFLCQMHLADKQVEALSLQQPKPLETNRG